jgi:hypothetical protein
MTFGTSNLLLFFLAEGYMIIKGGLNSTGPGLHNCLRKSFLKKVKFSTFNMSTPIQKKYRFSPLSYYEIPKLTFYFLLHCRCLIVFPTGLAKLVVQSAQKIYICWAVRKSKRFKDWS